MTRFFVAGHALIERESKYLVTQRSKSSGYMPMKWDIPGGIVEPGEALEDTINREVQEETGLTIRIGHVIYAYTNRDQLPQRQTFQIVYLCKYESGKVVLDLSEHVAYKWIDFANITNLEIIAFVQGLIKSYNPTTFEGKDRF
jgi:8-oxo-dGTP diphosphatase